MLALLTTGTFTWYQAAEIRNEFSGTKDDGEVTVRDDFDGNAMKDVFVENKGTTTLYVRAKLDEALSLSSNAWRPSYGDWVTHTYGATAPDCGHKNHTGQWAFHEYFKWTMGGWKYYMPSPSGETQYSDTNTYGPGDPGVKQTPNASVIAAAAWQAMDETQKDAFIGWIYAPDGYAYWSQPLDAGEATGLLLHGVQRQNELLRKYNYYYAINVIVEIADLEDVPMMRDGASSVTGDGATYTEADKDGKDILDWLTNKDEPVKPPVLGPGISINSGDRVIAIGEEIQLGYTITPAGYDAGKTIHWSGDNGTAIDLDVSLDGKTATVKGRAKGTVHITIWIEVDEGEILEHTITVTVTDGGGGGETDLPVGEGPFVPIYNGDPEAGDGLYGKANFMDPGNPEDNLIFHNGAIHLEDVITDGNYSNVTAAAEAPFGSYITIGSDHHGKPSILYSYFPTNQEWKDRLGASDPLCTIPVKVTLTREEQSAVVTIHMIYPDCLVTLI